MNETGAATTTAAATAATTTTTTKTYHCKRERKREGERNKNGKRNKENEAFIFFRRLVDVRVSRTSSSNLTWTIQLDMGMESHWLLFCFCRSVCFVFIADWLSDIQLERGCCLIIDCRSESVICLNLSDWINSSRVADVNCNWLRP